MNLNYASQHQGLLAWSALAGPINNAVDIRNHVGFSFTFHVDTDILVDAIFEVTAAPADAVDPCIPGVFYPVEETVICNWMTAAPAPKSEVTIPAGTKKGTICTATLPCKPDAFIKVMAVSGDTGKVEVVVTLSGPK